MKTQKKPVHDKTRKLVVGLIALVIVLGVGFLVYSNASKSTSSNKVKVAASFYPLYFFTTQLGGDKVEVSNITPAGSEPHDYDPSTADIVKIEKSKLLVLNGVVETWGTKIKNTLNGSSVIVVTAGDSLLTKKLTEGEETATDPHIWLDPLLAKKEAHTIVLGLIKVDSDNKTYYERNEKKLDERFDQLDKDYRQGLSNCRSKDIVTSHAAFAYLGSRYGLNQVAIAGLSPDAEPSAQQLAEVANFAKKNVIKYIFFESLVSPKLSETVASEIGAQTLVLDPIEGLTDNDINSGKNYFSVMQNNLTNLRTALECS